MVIPEGLSPMKQMTVDEISSHLLALLVVAQTASSEENLRKGHTTTEVDPAA